MPPVPLPFFHRFTAWVSLSRRFHTLGADHKNIFRALLAVTVYLGLAKIAGALKELVVAAKYGAGPTIDAYALLFSISNFAVGIVTSVLITAILPLLIRLRNDSPHLLISFRRELFTVTLITGAIIGALFYVSVVLLIEHNYIGIYGAARSQATPMLLPLAAVTTLGIVNAMFAARLMAQFRNVNSILDGVPALTIMTTLLVFPIDGSAPLIWGTAAGLALQSAALLAALFWREKFELPALRIGSEVWPTALRLAGVLFLAQILVSVSNIFDQLMVAPLGAGSNASLGYNSRLMSLILSLGTVALTRSLLPILSDLQSRAPERARHLTIRWMTLLFGAGVAITFVSWFAAPALVDLLFHRGAFTADDSKMVTGVFRYALLQLPFYFPQIVIVQLIVSRGNYLPLLYIGALEAIVKLSANLVTIPLMGINGAMLSTAIMYMVALPPLYYFGLSRSKGAVKNGT
jgi:peptidoglycan biosynthesis protein MviN/MurJ (putative lipid II flippase)